MSVRGAPASSMPLVPSGAGADTDDADAPPQPGDTNSTRPAASSAAAAAAAKSSADALARATRSNDASEVELVTDLNTFIDEEWEPKGNGYDVARFNKQPFVLRLADYRRTERTCSSKALLDLIVQKLDVRGKEGVGKLETEAKAIEEPQQLRLLLRMIDVVPPPEGRPKEMRKWFVDAVKAHAKIVAKGAQAGAGRPAAPAAPAAAPAAAAAVAATPAASVLEPEASDSDAATDRRPPTKPVPPRSPSNPLRQVRNRSQLLGMGDEDEDGDLSPPPNRRSGVRTGAKSPATRRLDFFQSVKAPNMGGSSRSSRHVREQEPEPPRASEARRDRHRVPAAAAAPAAWMDQFTSPSESSVSDSSSSSSASSDDSDVPALGFRAPASGYSMRGSHAALRDRAHSHSSRSGRKRSDSFASGYIRNVKRESGGASLYRHFKDTETHGWGDTKRHSKEESLVLAKVIDALLEAPANLDMALDIATRRLAAVHAATELGDWTLANCIENRSNRTFHMDPRVMKAAIKEAAQLSALRKTKERTTNYASSGHGAGAVSSSSSYPRGNNKGSSYEYHDRRPVNDTRSGADTATHSNKKKETKAAGGSTKA
jgi:hypothetical protein